MVFEDKIESLSASARLTIAPYVEFGALDANIAGLNRLPPVPPVATNRVFCPSTAVPGGIRITINMDA
jgi:hypothetical protein